MASWKMAKAFGRAMSERMGKDGKAAKAVNNSEIAKAANNGVWNDKDIETIDAYRKGQREGNENFYVGREAATEDAMNRMDPDAKRIWENYDFDYERAYGPADAYRRAVELSGVEDAPSSSAEFFDRYGFDIADRPTPRNSDISRSISRVEDQNSDARLREGFDNAFNEAAENHGYNRWRKEAADKPVDDGLGGEIHNVERELTEDEVRQRMIDDLKRGVDISDVLEFGHGFFGK
jgi:hypothetical protein